MKKVIVLLALLALVVPGFCWVGCAIGAGTPVTETLEATKEFVGTVVEVATFQEPGSSGLVKVTVADKAGKTEIFPIDQTIRVLDAGLNVVAMNTLKKGDKVSIEYKEEEGAKKPTAVKIAK